MIKDLDLELDIAYKIPKQASQSLDVFENFKKEDFMIACKLAQNKQIAKLLDLIDGYDGEENLFAFLYSIFNDVPLARQLNNDSEFVREFCNEYSLKFLNDLPSELEDVFNSSSFLNSEYRSYGRGRLRHLYNLVKKLQLNIKCISDLALAKGPSILSNKSLYDHFKILLKHGIINEMVAFKAFEGNKYNQESRQKDIEHEVVKDRVKYKEEFKAKEPEVQRVPKQNLSPNKEHDLDKGFNIKSENADNMSKQKIKENVKTEAKEQDKGKVCGCGLKVCIKEELQRQNPGMVFIKR